MTIYNTGTVSVTNGNAVVAGSGTAWAVALISGGIFSSAGVSVPILSVGSDTSLTLAYAWPGTTATGAVYAIARENSEAADIVNLNDRLSQVLVKLSLIGIHPDNSGSLAKRNALALHSEDDNYIFLRAELGIEFAFYRWDGPTLSWVGPFTVADAVAGGGVSSIVGGTGISVDNTNPAIPVISLAGAKREVLTADRTYYVGYNLGSVSVSVASPAVVTKNAHGLVAGSRVSFSILPNTKTATISVGSPAIVTMANTFAAGQPIVFQSTGRLPKGITAGTTYYVIAAGLSGASFQFSATPGGAAINTSNPTVTVSQASPCVVTEAGHGRAAGDAIQFATTGALPTGLSVATTYFVKTVLDANTYTVSATSEGAAINTTSAGSGTHTIVQFGTHYLSETGTLPTGITAGQDYYAIPTGLTANTFQFSATAGGAAINTSGSTSGTIRLKTGSDSGTGLIYSPTDAFLTIQKAVDTAAALDLGIYNAIVLIDAGTYLAGVTPKSTVGAGTVYLRGKSLDLFSTALSTTGSCVDGINGFQGNYKAEYLTLRSGAYGMIVLNGTLLFGNINFGTCTNSHFTVGVGGFIRADENYMISGGASSAHMEAYDGAQIKVQGRSVTSLNVPVFGSSFASAGRVGTMLANGNTYNGFATGKRYDANLNGILLTLGGASYFPGSIAGTTGTGGQYT
ncbi:hypothetical protein [Mesorhizobium sp. M00.F.Ca.ET.217.01.1.1]|uniref:hypothetical protein n=1 Tax=Mesorhizobium sp. M00.F.Ca.ET.217.01.1.1 TaxID=2500529 RepID=UPI000FDA0C0D|nr:hypothetical protein [Mesorhizobium sp. M00.F.Ca.ET.217.01.1.1]TGQ19338.1 hypothetical protein EN860_019615 [Mesorhizobium sp. M00.F.Ca.ET.217.01.1.1]